MKLQVAKSVVVILGLFNIPLYGQKSYETFVLQRQRERAKHQHQRQRGLVHGTELFVHPIHHQHLQRGGGHEHGRAHVNALQLVGNEEKDEGEEVKQEFHQGAECRRGARQPAGRS